MEFNAIILIIVVVLIVVHFQLRRVPDPTIMFHLDLKQQCNENMPAPDTKIDQPEQKPDVPKNLDISYDSTEASENYRMLFGGSLNDDELCGDDKFAFKMWDMGQKNKHALTNRAIMNKDTFAKYYHQEMRDHENSIWWDDETLEQEM